MIIWQELDLGARLFLSLNLDGNELRAAGDKLLRLRQKSHDERGLYPDARGDWEQIADVLQYHIIIYECQNNNIIGIYEYGKVYSRTKRIMMTGTYIGKDDSGGIWERLIILS